MKPRHKRFAIVGGLVVASAAVVATGGKGAFSEDAPGQPRGAWFPFGWGNRRCIGEQFAWTEATLVLATLAQRWAPQLMPGADVTPMPAVTLRTRNGMPMVLRRR